MTVCVLGPFSPSQDEGEENVAHYLSREIARYQDIARLNIREFRSRRFWEAVAGSPEPRIIHYLGAATAGNLLLLSLLRLRWMNRPKSVFSVLFPEIDPVFQALLPVAKPDLLLLQSGKSETLVRDRGCRTRLLPNGVDTDRFRPVTPEAKKKLREQYGIDRESFVVLHVGHLKENRNLGIFEELGEDGVQGVIVASMRLAFDHGLYRRLTESGCLIRTGYCERIEEYYQLADCYLFPVFENQSIATPLSVLEAMACNLPVVSRRFDGLAGILAPGGGLIFCESDRELVEGVRACRAGGPVRTRERIMHVSWDAIGRELNEIYRQIAAPDAGGRG